jgi:hypothetical protein
LAPFQSTGSRLNRSDSLSATARRHLEELLIPDEQSAAAGAQLLITLSEIPNNNQFEYSQ